MISALFEEFRGGRAQRRIDRKQAVGLAATLAVHALLILGAVKARFEVKLLPVQRRVINVLPAPRIHVSLPADYREHLADLDLLEAGGDAYWGTASRVSGTRGERITQSVSTVDSPAVRRGEVSDPGSDPLFVLSYRPGSERSGVPEFDLRRPEGTGAPAAGRASGPGISDPRLRTYPSTDLRGGTRGGGGGDYALARTSTGDRVIYRGRAPSGVQSVELAAWGRQVVEAVQKQWIIPVGEDEIKGGKVGVSVVVEKDGRASLARIDASSNVALLDRSALAAITACLPFPPLPEDFPGRNIEAFFLFDCHEK